MLLLHGFPFVSVVVTKKYLARVRARNRKCTGSRYNGLRRRSDDSTHSVLTSVRERVVLLGVEPLGGGTSGQFREHIRRESATWADVIKRAGVRPD